jgi:hypothetical protein
LAPSRVQSFSTLAVLALPCLKPSLEGAINLAKLSCRKA